MGEAVDKRHSGLSGGELTIDPTENVKALQLASAQRQDDLRQLNDRRIDAEIRVLATKVEAAEREILLRSDHAREIRALESGATSLASARALTAIETLASQTTGTATTIAAQLSETIAGLVGRIAQLEKSSYEGAGKQAVADPMQAEMTAKMERVLTVLASGTGQSQGAKNTVTYVVIAVGLLVSFITIGSAVIAIAFAIRR